MSFDTSWDINYYKTDYESDEHWQLRRRFMEYHKDKFPEDELVCLAQVFTNVEFMGCKYPAETMEMVARLSEDIAKEFRQQRSKRLQRTFVEASSAAEARAKGRVTKPNNRPSPYVRGESYNNKFKKSEGETTSTKSTGTNLLAGLPFGKFILFLIGDRNAIKASGQRCGVDVTERETIVDGRRKVEILVGGKIVGESDAVVLKESKALAFDAAIETLQKNCFSIKPKLNPDRIDISKNNATIICKNKSSQEQEINKLDSNNIGFKMMQKLGWSGGGLGSKTQGRENPVDFLIKHDRRGLGDQSDAINSNYFREMLHNYIKSDDIRDLYFESGFTKEERATLHHIASEKNLKSSSYGKEPNRHLIITKKNITPLKIVEEIILYKNPKYMNKYEVKVPQRLAERYPDHRDFLSN